MTRAREDVDESARLSWASSAGVRRSMRSNRGRDTLLELRFRSALHKAGLRYRTHLRPIPELRCTVDVAFPKDRVAVLIDGCYWHSCPVHRSAPRTNGDWWAAKLQATQKRDRANTLALEQAGWTVLRIWEHEHVDDVVGKVQDVLRDARAASSARRKQSHGQPV